ncbi:MAG TPA: RimK family alpha-L-glutamate ligase [Anaerolineae bacterium]|nr:RimK family alpha-L-glutamate ligase [Anaerolineae bacterium]
MKLRAGVLCSRVRLEEKLLLDALRDRGVESERIDVQAIGLELPGGLDGYDLILIRCLSHWRALYASKLLAAGGQRILNTHAVIATCGDGLLTSLALFQSGVPTPRTKAAFSPQAALVVIEQMGYPVMLQPAPGSPEALRVSINDKDAAETILEHRDTLGGEQQSIFCIQQSVGRPLREFRTLVVGEEVVAAIHRPPRQGGVPEVRGEPAEDCPVTSEMEQISRAAAAAVGGGVLAVDIQEGADGRLLVSGVHHTPQFRTFSSPAFCAGRRGQGDIAACIADYCLSVINVGATA